jgi:hypothetical protein
MITSAERESRFCNTTLWLYLHTGIKTNVDWNFETGGHSLAQNRPNGGCVFSQDGARHGRPPAQLLFTASDERVFAVTIGVSSVTARAFLFFFEP